MTKKKLSPETTVTVNPEAHASHAGNGAVPANTAFGNPAASANASASGNPAVSTSASERTVVYGESQLARNYRVSHDTRKTGLNNNMLLIGGPGSGKTGGFVYSTLKNLDDSSLIVADTKGLLHRQFRDELEQKGFRVYCLDFVNPENSCGWNPLDYVRRNRDGSIREQDLLTISNALVPSDLEKEETFWPLSAQNALQFFLSYTLEALPEEDHNMITVNRLYHAFQRPNGDVGFMSYLLHNPDSFAAMKYAEMTGTRTAERTFSSIMAFVNLAMAPFSFSESKCIFQNENRLDIRSLGREKSVLFLNLSDCDAAFDNLTNLFYTQALTTLISEADGNPDGKLRVPIHIILDDFASAAKVPCFDRIISVVRSRDIWLTPIIQSISQLYSRYGEHSGTTIINNCDRICFLGGNDLKTAEFIGTRAYKTPDSILCMNRSFEYVLEAGKPARLMEKIPPYSDLAS